MGTRRQTGPESDPAGYHLIRGWVPAGVRAQVLDPADRTPYWFVATRHPAALCQKTSRLWNARFAALTR